MQPPPSPPRRRSLVCVAWILFSILVSPATALADDPPPPAPHITVLVQDAPAIGGPASALAKSWEIRTGGKVTVVKRPFGELFQTISRGIRTDPATYDVIFYAPAWAGDLHHDLQPLPQSLRRHESFDDIHETYRDRLMQWNGEWIAVTVDGDLFSGYYRKDLFADPAAGAAFRAEYGRELLPPQTWEDYRDIARFFTGRRAADGTLLYGTAEPFARGGQQFWDLFSRASAYTNHPDLPGGQFFHPETMQAQINNPGWVRAVREYREALSYSPPDALGYGIVQSRQAFIHRAQTALALDWGDTGQMSADKAQSPISGKVGYFVLPGTREVWNWRQQHWDSLPRIHKAPFLAFGGWVASVPRTSRHPDAAWDFIMWYASPENSLDAVVTSGTGINPYRYTHFSNIDAWSKAFSHNAASEYLGVLRASLDSPHAALDLRIPGFHEYTEILEEGLTAVLKNNADPQHAMDDVARGWDAVTDRLGRDRQLALYRASMGLPPQP
ncbi:MAG: extracellular solute-binding protein [Magnetococcus sp. WYHC-3]